MQMQSPDGTIFELNGSSDATLGRLFWYRKFDAALVGFLSCVEELCTTVAARDPSFLFPYSVVRDRIGPPNAMLSVRYQFAEESVWSRALKYVLTNLKYVVAFLAKQRLEQHDHELRASSRN